MTKDLWPWPADTPTDRARRIARSYRDALHRADPDTCATLDGQATKLGQGWIVPRVVAYDENELLTRWQAADHCGVKTKTITEWCRRGLKTTATPDGVRYRVGDLDEYRAALRRKRAG